MQVNMAKVTFKSGKEITKYVLQNDNHMEVEILSTGATLTRIMVPDAEGKVENVILGFKDIDLYEENGPSFGATVGRIAGRIYDGKVTLEGKEYHFAKNNNGNTLHGGIVGFSKKDWQGEAKVVNDQAVLTLSYLSPDGEEGFPGNLAVKVTYTLTNDNSLTLKYEGKTDKETIVNLTNHAYFNLSGDTKRKVLNQEVYINSDRIAELDHELIPTGKILSLDDKKVFDFRVPKTIGQDIDADDEMLKYGNGYDHAWLLNKGDKAVEVYEPISKRYMQIKTTAPGVVMYTMNGADGTMLSSGKGAEARDAVCFENQRLAIGHNEVFKEDVILKPNETYFQETTWTFGVK